MVYTNLGHCLFVWGIKFLTTTSSLKVPLLGKEIINHTFIVSVFVGYKGLEWVRYLHIDHTLSIVVLAGDVKSVIIIPSISNASGEGIGPSLSGSEPGVRPLYEPEKVLYSVYHIAT